MGLITMNGQQIQTLALKTALSLPETTLTQPFGEGCDVVKVMDKVFLLSTGFVAQRFII